MDHLVPVAFLKWSCIAEKTCKRLHEWHAGYDYNKLAPTILFMQLIHGTDIGIGFTCTCFHLWLGCSPTLHREDVLSAGFHAGRSSFEPPDVLQHLRFHELDSRVSVTYFFFYFKVYGLNSCSRLFGFTYKLFATSKVNRLVFNGCPLKQSITAFTACIWKSCSLNWSFNAQLLIVNGQFPFEDLIIEVINLINSLASEYKLSNASFSK